MTTPRLCTFAAAVLLAFASSALAQQSAPPPAAGPDAPPTIEWKLGGRLMLDAAVYGGSENDLASGMKLRRSALAVALKYGNWGGQIDADFADGTITVRDTYVSWVGRPNTLLRAGNFREPFGLEVLTSSRYLPFVERALLEALTPGRRLGVMATTWGRRWNASTGVFGATVPGALDTSGDDQSVSVAGRLTARPFLRGDSFVHVGAAALRITPDAASKIDFTDAAQMRLTASPETRVHGGKFLDTGTLFRVSHRRLYGLESAAVFGSLSWQGEYARTVVDHKDDFIDPAFDTWYGFVSWFPTGDHRPYEPATGTFGRVVPRHRRGALELLARVSAMDLNDPAAGIYGGRERIVTLGATWYANLHVRVMANYLNVWNDDFTFGNRNYIPNDNFHIVQTRLQFVF